MSGGALGGASVCSCVSAYSSMPLAEAASTGKVAVSPAGEPSLASSVR